MSAPPITYEFFRGDTFKIDLPVTQFNPTTQKDEPLNITGSTIWMTAKRYLAESDSNAVFQLESPGAIVFTDPVNGLARATIPHSATVNLPAQCTRLFYDFQLLTPGSEVYTIEKGLLVIDPDVTITVTP